MAGQRSTVLEGLPGTAFPVVPSAASSQGEIILGRFVGADIGRSALKRNQILSIRIGRTEETGAFSWFLFYHPRGFSI